MTEEEFCRQYVEHMMLLAGRESFKNGESVREFAKFAAAERWREKKATVHPHTAAEVDISYLEDE